MFVFSHSDYSSFVSVRNQAGSFIVENKKTMCSENKQCAQSFLWGEAEGTNHATDDVRDPFTGCGAWDWGV